MKPGVCILPICHFNYIRTIFPSIHYASCSNLCQFYIIKSSSEDSHWVWTLDSVRWKFHSPGEVTIICYYKETLAKIIKSSDWDNVLVYAKVFQSAKYGHSTIWIIMSRNHFLRLMKQPNSCILFYWSELSCFCIDCNFAVFCYRNIWFYLFSIHFNHALINHFFCHSSWGNTHSWKSFWKPLCLWKILNST